MTQCLSQEENEVNEEEEEEEEEDAMELCIAFVKYSLYL